MSILFYWVNTVQKLIFYQCPKFPNDKITLASQQNIRLFSINHAPNTRAWEVQQFCVWVSQQEQRRGRGTWWDPQGPGPLTPARYSLSIDMGESTVPSHHRVVKSVLGKINSMERESRCVLCNSGWGGSEGRPLLRHLSWNPRRSQHAEILGEKIPFGGNIHCKRARQMLVAGAVWTLEQVEMGQREWEGSSHPCKPWEEWEAAAEF